MRQFDTETFAAPAEIIQAELSFLMALPDVAAARTRVLEAFKNEVAEMRRMISADARFEVAGSPERRFADALGTA